MSRLITGLKALVTAVAVIGITAVSSPADAASGPAEVRVTAATIEASLHGQDLVRWETMSTSKRAVTLRILSDEAFGLPSQASGLQKKYPELRVTVVRSGGAVAQPLSVAATTTSRTSWVRQNWTIFGITYTEVTTTMGYTTSGAVVTGVSRCYGTYVNYVPLRSISSNSWYTLGNGLADCWTEWTLGRPLQPTVTGVQGLRVNGYGTILKVWYV